MLEEEDAQVSAKCDLMGSGLRNVDEESTAECCSAQTVFEVLAFLSQGVKDDS